MGRYATKKYVNYKVEEGKWSPVQRVVEDFEAHVVNGGNGDRFNLYDLIAADVTLHENWTRHNTYTDGTGAFECDFRIKYIRLHARAATGEAEGASAVSQTVRFIIFWTDHPYQSGDISIVADVDGMPRYSDLFGEINGLWYDKTQYVHSWASDATTTAGGQVMFKRVIRPLHSDVLSFIEPEEEYESEKGQVFLQILGDDPSGSNSQVYGWCEVGYEYKMGV